MRALMDAWSEVFELKCWTKQLVLSCIALAGRLHCSAEWPVLHSSEGLRKWDRFYTALKSICMYICRDNFSVFLWIYEWKRTSKMEGRRIGVHWAGIANWRNSFSCTESNCNASMSETLERFSGPCLIGCGRCLTLFLLARYGWTGGMLWLSALALAREGRPCCSF